MIRTNERRSQREQHREILKDWFLLPIEGDAYPDFARKDPSIFVEIFVAETHLPQKVQYMMGLPLKILHQYLRESLISLDDVLVLFLKVDLLTDDLLEILTGLPLDRQIYAFYRLVMYRIDDVNDLFELWTNRQEWPELKAEDRDGFQQNCAQKICDWVLSMDAPIDAGLPFVFLGLLDADTPCVIWDLALKQLEAQLDRSVTGRIKDRHTLIRLIKVSLLVGSVPDYLNGYESWTTYLSERFLQTLMTLDEKALMSMLLRLPQYFVDQVVAMTFSHLNSDIVMVQENAGRLWESFWSISKDRCATLSIALASNPSYLNWGQEQ